MSTNVLTPFSYAQEETPEVIPENEVGNVEEDTWESGKILENNEETPEINEKTPETNPEEKGELEQGKQEEETPENVLSDAQDDVDAPTKDENKKTEENEKLLECDENLKSNENTLENSALVQAREIKINEIDLNNFVQIVREWEVISTYTWLSQAINESESGDVINIVEDISVSEASVLSWKSLTINWNNHIITREADITTLAVNENSSLKLIDITITDNAVNFAPNRYDSLLRAKTSISLCPWWVNETRNESGDVTASACATENVDTAKTNPQIYSVWNIYGNNLTISNSLNSKWSAAIIVEKWWIEMINSNFIHNWASGWWRGWAIRVWPNSVTNIVDESPITKILFSWCLFENNYSSAYWWALAFHYAPETITIDNCIFSGNTASTNWWAIHIPNIWTNPTWSLPRLPDWSLFPVWTMYVTNSDFYSNWCGNDGSAIENDDKNLEIDTSKFEHNYWMRPATDSVWVISCQAGWSNRRSGRGLIWPNFKIKNSTFRDTNMIVLWDHGRVWSYLVDNCLFEDQMYVLLSYHWRWEIKNSIIKNSKDNCGKVKWYSVDDVFISLNWDITPYFGEALFRLENNSYTNDCTTNLYFQAGIVNKGKWILNLEIKDDAEVYLNRHYYDGINAIWLESIYYWATIDDWKYAYIKKNKFYNFDEFNEELSKNSNWYQLESWKTMLFYLDSGYTELWSGSISTTTNLYWKEADIHNITYEWMEGVDFEWITHTYKFNNLNHSQYLTELTPYALNNPSKNWYKFEWRFLDSWYTLPITSIERWLTWDITLYAKRYKLWYSGWWGGWWNSKKTDEDTRWSAEESQKNTQDDKNTENVIQSDPEHSEWGSEEFSNTPIDSSDKSLEWQEILSPSDSSFTKEQKDAYTFAHENWITTKDTIQSAQMNGKLTRIAMAKMLSQYAINVLWKEPDVSKWVVKFNDVTSKKDADYDNGVTLAYQLGIMWQNMPWNNFRPNDEVTRAEFVTALSRLLYQTTDGEYKSTKEYYIPHMAKLYNEWIINNTDPWMKERRWYVMIMLMRSAK